MQKGKVSIRVKKQYDKENQGKLDRVEKECGGRKWK